MEIILFVIGLLASYSVGVAVGMRHNVLKLRKDGWTVEPPKKGIKNDHP